jgi:VIT1/CCC1 family predicted Fe2+/Mn2+ transporter
VTVPDRDLVARVRPLLQQEREGAWLYRALSDAERDPKLAEVFRRLAAVEDVHARRWEDILREAGETAPPRRPGLRTRLLAWIARRWSVQAVLPAVLAAERADTETYGASAPGLDASSLAGHERSHARLIGAMMAGEGGLAGGTLARLEGRHRAVGGNALRAAVLGANDGLVSNLSLVMGVAGAAFDAPTILVAGLAGLVAGAGSMAMGEWLSVQSSRELYGRQIEIERQEIQAAPEEEAAELALIYEAKGLPPEQARALAARLIADPATALDTLAREELGIDPVELGGSAWVAAGASFGLFAIGAVVPVLPFALLEGSAAIAASVGLSAVALFAIGAAITLLTGRGVLFSGLRQLAIGLGAAGLTFAVGRLLRVAITG